MIYSKLRRETYDKYKELMRNGTSNTNPEFIRLHSLLQKMGRSDGQWIWVEMEDGKEYELSEPVANGNVVPIQKNPNVTLPGEGQKWLNRNWEKVQSDKQAQNIGSPIKLNAIERKIRDAIVKVLTNKEKYDAINFLIAIEDQWLAAPPWVTAEQFEKLKPQPNRTKPSQAEFEEMFEQRKNKRYAHTELEYLQSQIKQARGKDVKQLLALYPTFDQVNSATMEYTRWRIDGTEVNLEPIKSVDQKKYLNSIIEKLNIKQESASR